MLSKSLAVGILCTVVLATDAFALRLNDQVQLMSEPGRRNFIGMLLKQSGIACPAVRRTFYQGQLERQGAVWNASCDGKDGYAVLFKDDDERTTRVMRCTELVVLGTVTGCFKKF